MSLYKKSVSHNLYTHDLLDNVQNEQATTFTLFKPTLFFYFLPRASIHSCLCSSNEIKMHIVQKYASSLSLSDTVDGNLCLQLTNSWSLTQARSVAGVLTRFKKYPNYRSKVLMGM